MGDFLTYVARQMFVGRTILDNDLTGLRAWSRRRWYDRGVALEDAMERYLQGRLRTSFDALMAGEKEGWRPSLIFSPMMVEDGRTLLISNLDLRSVSENRGPILFPPDDLLSRESIEFFRLFPEATQFEVGTAARMSASFPYVMPAVPLPTDPPRRVVDAGYYDNFGMVVAASWVFNQLDWLIENASGVVLIQVRDGVSEKARRCEIVPDALPSPIARGIQWLTSPLEGGCRRATSSSSFRNDNLITLLNQCFLQGTFGPRKQGFGRGYFQTVAFEFPRDDVSLSFYLTESEKREIDNPQFWDVTSPASPATSLRPKVNALLNWWNDRLAHE